MSALMRPRDDEPEVSRISKASQIRNDDLDSIIN